MINKDKTLDLRGIWGTWGMIDPRLASINLANMVKGCKRKMVATTIHQVPTMRGPPVISWFISPSNYSYKYNKP